MERNPLVFEGTVDLTMAEEWISMIEKVFEFVQIEEEEKVKYAMYMLIKDVRIWWELVKKNQDVAIMTWVEVLGESIPNTTIRPLLTAGSRVHRVAVRK